MEFFQRAAGRPGWLAILPGTFNPITVAHERLARAALSLADEIVFVLPRVFPHKTYAGAEFEERIGMLQSVLAREPACSIAAAEGALFLEIARECRAAYGREVRLSFVCGRDAAERIVNWDYGRPGAASEMLSEFDLLVAGRDGPYQPPPALGKRIFTLDLAGACDGVSSSEVRRRIAEGERWEDLVPDAVRDRVRRIYGVPTGWRLPAG